MKDNSNVTNGLSNYYKSSMKKQIIVNKTHNAIFKLLFYQQKFDHDTILCFHFVLTVEFCHAINYMVQEYHCDSRKH